MAKQPTIFSRSEAGLAKSGTNGIDSFNQGTLGPIHDLTFHHTSGPRATDNQQARALNRSIQAYHVSKGWGDYAYHFSMDDAGRIYHGRPLAAKGTHTASHNSGNVGFVLHGNYEVNELTDKQNESLRWLFTGGFYVLLKVKEKDLTIRTHHEWDGNHGTDCPGSHFQRHIKYLRDTEKS